MKIGINSQTSPKTKHLSDYINEIERCCKQEFEHIHIDDILAMCYLGVNLSEFESKINIVSNYKNYKAERGIEFILNLDIKKYINNNLEQFKFNFFNDFKIGALEVFEKKVKNKNLGEIVILTMEKALFNRANQTINDLISIILNANSKNTITTDIIQYKALKNDIFWQLISEAFLSSNNFQEGVKALENLLSRKEDLDIIGFQITLRKLIKELDNDFIINKAKTINGYVTDDLFLYMKCKLITKGANFYKQLKNKSDVLIDHEYFEFNEGELLLYVADNSIEIKYEGNYNSELPSYIAQQKYGVLL